MGDIDKTMHNALRASVDIVASPTRMTERIQALEKRLRIDLETVERMRMFKDKGWVAPVVQFDVWANNIKEVLDGDYSCLEEIDP